MNKIFVIDEQSQNIRLDKFLVDVLKTNRSQVQHLIKNNLIELNHIKVTKSGIFLKLNDVVEILEPIAPSIKTEQVIFDLALKVYYEDDDLIVVYKPSGLLTHATSYHETATLFNALRNYFNYQIEPLMVHRLDKDTSGLIIVAKNQTSQAALLDMFMQRAIIKKYYALVHKPFDEQHFFIDVAIGRSKDNKMKMIAGEGKNLKPSLTEVYVLKNWNKFALIDLILHTGRTHQIRVHLNYINHPIVNDPLYSQYKTNSDYHQYLMAYYLKFNHPLNHQEILIQIEMDQEFKDYIAEIEKLHL